MSASGWPPQNDGGWRAYREQMFDLAVAPNDFVRWKICSTGVTFARQLADVRNNPLGRWWDLHGRRQSDWPVQHPPVVVVMSEPPGQPASAASGSAPRSSTTSW